MKSEDAADCFAHLYQAVLMKKHVSVYNVPVRAPRQKKTETLAEGKWTKIEKGERTEKTTGKKGGKKI